MSVVGDKVRAVVERMRAQRPLLPDGQVKVRVAPPAPPLEPVVDVSFRTAMAGMADRQFCMGTKYREQQTRAAREGAHPEIVEFADLLVRRMNMHNVPMFAHGFVRSSDEQDALYDAGFSKAVGGRSPHNYGMAVDLIHGVKAWNLTDRQWAIIGHIGKEIAAQRGFKLVWGGLDHPGDKFGWDPAHWELADWKQRRIPRYLELDP